MVNGQILHEESKMLNCINFFFNIAEVKETKVMQLLCTGR